MKLAPAGATHVRTFDVQKLRAEQAPIPDRLATALKDLTLAPTKGDGPTIGQHYDRLIARAEKAGGHLGHVAVADLRRGKADAEHGTARTAGEGFTRRADLALKNYYEAAKSGRILTERFETRDEATSFISTQLERLQNYADVINRHGGGDPTVGGPYTGLKSGPQPGDSLFEMFDARAHDYLEASRMELVIEAQRLARTFGIGEPIYGVVDGRLRINAFDVSWGGDAIARSLGDGAMLEFRGDGTIGLDRRV